MNIKVYIVGRELKPSGYFFRTRVPDYDVETYSRYVAHPIALELHKRGVRGHKFDVYDERGMKLLQDLDVEYHTYNRLKDGSGRLRYTKVDPYGEKERLSGISV